MRASFIIKVLECQPTSAERIQFRNRHFAIPNEVADVGDDQQLPTFLGERVMGNLKMHESGGHHLNPKRNLKSLKVGQADITRLLTWYLIQW